MPRNLEPRLRAAVERYAGEYAIPVDILTALVWVESDGDPYAWRPEPLYRWLWDCRRGAPWRTADPALKVAPSGFAPPQGLPSSRDAEWLGQQASWGPLQVMGAVAREYGYLGHFPGLCGPEGVRYGCEHLRRLHRRFFASHQWAGVIAAYNAGSPRFVGERWENQSYVDKVYSYLRES